MRPAADDIVHTVRDAHGAWALFTDEALADGYAGRVHGIRGPDMTREAAERLVHGDMSANARQEVDHA